jgi:hypothetical protein
MPRMLDSRRFAGIPAAIKICLTSRSACEWMPQIGMGREIHSRSCEATVCKASHLCLALFFSIHPAMPVVALIKSDHAAGSTFGKLSHDEGDGNMGLTLTLVSLPGRRIPVSGSFRMENTSGRLSVSIGIPVSSVKSARRSSGINRVSACSGPNAAANLARVA